MTIYDIAREADVSISSVSRYFNHPDLLSAKTKERISRVIDESDFIPNQLARGLVLNSVKSIGILMNDIQNSRFSTIAYNLEHSFFDWGYDTVFCSTGDDWPKIQQYMSMLASRRIDALIILGSMYSMFDVNAALEKYFPPELPIFSTDIVLDRPNAYAVTADHNYGLRAAVKHLAEKGHRNIAFVACTGSLNTERKIDAFHRALAAFGLPFYREDNVIQIPLSSCADLDLDVPAIVRSTNVDYSALIFSHDSLAARAVNSLHYHGVRVPEDMAIIGYDNSPYALCSQPLLTSIDSKSSTIARIVANLVNDVFNQRAVGNHVIVKPTLLVRNST